MLKAWIPLLERATEMDLAILRAGSVPISAGDHLVATGTDLAFTKAIAQVFGAQAIDLVIAVDIDRTCPRLACLIAILNP